MTALLATCRRAIAQHAWFDLVCAQQRPRKVIALLGLEAVFSCPAGVVDAVDAPAAQKGAMASEVSLVHGRFLVVGYASQGRATGAGFDSVPLVDCGVQATFVGE